MRSRLIPVFLICIWLPAKSLHAQASRQTIWQVGSIKVAPGQTRSGFIQIPIGPE